MIFFGKLVHDKIPEMIQANGEIPEFERLNEERYLEELDKKLNEEVKEYQESKEADELADIVEVVYAICEAKGISVEQLQEIREKKKVLRGGFSERYFLICKKQ